LRGEVRLPGPLLSIVVFINLHAIYIHCIWILCLGKGRRVDKCPPYLYVKGFFKPLV
jgi:hypothetical protein